MCGDIAVWLIPMPSKASVWEVPAGCLRTRSGRLQNCAWAGFTSRDKSSQSQQTEAAYVTDANRRA